jgi:hypothetical protein
MLGLQGDREIRIFVTRRSGDQEIGLNKKTKKIRRGSASFDL